MSIHYYRLRTVLQQAANPFGDLGVYSNGVEFLEKFGMVDLVEGFAEIKEDSINFFAFI